MFRKTKCGPFGMQCTATSKNHETFMSGWANCANTWAHLPMIWSPLKNTRRRRKDLPSRRQQRGPNLIAHAAHTRPLGAGTIIGSGTVSNTDVTRGYACILERRLVEHVETGESLTPFLQYGDEVSIDMADAEGQSVFGAIDQAVERWGG